MTIQQLQEENKNLKEMSIIDRGFIDYWEKEASKAREELVYFRDKYHELLRDNAEKKLRKPSGFGQ